MTSSRVIAASQLSGFFFGCEPGVRPVKFYFQSPKTCFTNISSNKTEKRVQMNPHSFLLSILPAAFPQPAFSGTQAAVSEPQPTVSGPPDRLSDLPDRPSGPPSGRYPLSFLPVTVIDPGEPKEYLRSHESGRDRWGSFLQVRYTAYHPLCPPQGQAV